MLLAKMGRQIILGLNAGNVQHLKKDGSGITMDTVGIELFIEGEKIDEIHVIGGKTNEEISQYLDEIAEGGSNVKGEKNQSAFH